MFTNVKCSCDVLIGTPLAAPGVVAGAGRTRWT